MSNPGPTIDYQKLQRELLSIIEGFDTSKHKEATRSKQTLNYLIQQADNADKMRILVAAVLKESQESNHQHLKAGGRNLLAHQLIQKLYENNVEKEKLQAAQMAEIQKLLADALKETKKDTKIAAQIEAAQRDLANGFVDSGFAQILEIQYQTSKSKDLVEIINTIKVKRSLLLRGTTAAELSSAIATQASPPSSPSIDAAPSEASSSLKDTRSVKAQSKNQRQMVDKKSMTSKYDLLIIENNAEVFAAVKKLLEENYAARQALEAEVKKLAEESRRLEAEGDHKGAKQKKALAQKKANEAAKIPISKLKHGTKITLGNGSKYVLKNSFIGLANIDASGKVSIQPYAMARGEYLGEGAYGYVKIAQDTLGKNYAVKIEGRGKRAEDEAESIITRLIGYSKGETEAKLEKSKEFKKGVTDTKLYSMMELYLGDELYNALYENPIVEGAVYVPGSPERKKEELSPEQKLIIGIKCAQAIYDLHNRGVIHGDVKPANFMASIRGELITIGAIDFGFSMLLTPDGKPIEKDEVPEGTHIDYMPPEVLQGDKRQASHQPGRKAQFSKASDIYSLGMMLKHDLGVEADFVEQMLADNPENRGNLSEIITALSNHLEQNTKQKRSREAAELIQDTSHGVRFVQEQQGPKAKRTLVMQLITGFRDPGDFVHQTNPSFYTLKDYKMLAPFLYAKTPPETFFKELEEALFDENITEPKDKEAMINNAMLLIDAILQTNVTDDLVNKTELGLKGSESESVIGLIDKIKDKYGDNFDAQLAEMEQRLDTSLAAAREKQKQIEAKTAAIQNPDLAAARDITTLFRQPASPERDRALKEAAADAAKDLKKMFLEIYASIDPTDCHRAWSAPGSSLLRINDATKMLSQMITDQLLDAPNPDVQKTIFKFYLDVLDNAIALGDCQTILGINAGLNDLTLRRLDHIRDDPEIAPRFQALQEQFSISAMNPELKKMRTTALDRDTTFVPALGEWAYYEAYGAEKRPYERKYEVDGQTVKKLNEDRILFNGELIYCASIAVERAAKDPDVQHPYRTQLVSQLPTVELTDKQKDEKENAYISKSYIELDAIKTLEQFCDTSSKGIFRTYLKVKSGGVEYKQAEALDQIINHLDRIYKDVSLNNRQPDTAAHAFLERIEKWAKDNNVTLTQNQLSKLDAARTALKVTVAEQEQLDQVNPDIVLAQYIKTPREGGRTTVRQHLDDAEEQVDASLKERIPAIRELLNNVDTIRSLSTILDDTPGLDGNKKISNNAGEFLMLYAKFHLVETGLVTLSKVENQQIKELLSALVTKFEDTLPQDLDTQIMQKYTSSNPAEREAIKSALAAMADDPKGIKAELGKLDIQLKNIDRIDKYQAEINQLEDFKIMSASPEACIKVYNRYVALKQEIETLIKSPDPTVKIQAQALQARFGEIFSDEFNTALVKKLETEIGHLTGKYNDLLTARPILTEAIEAAQKEKSKTQTDLQLTDTFTNMTETSAALAKAEGELAKKPSSKRRQNIHRAAEKAHKKAVATYEGSDEYLIADAAAQKVDELQALKEKQAADMSGITAFLSNVQAKGSGFSPAASQQAKSTRTNIDELTALDKIRTGKNISELTQAGKEERIRILAKHRESDNPLVKAAAEYFFSDSCPEKAEYNSALKALEASELQTAQEHFRTIQMDIVSYLREAAENPKFYKDEGRKAREKKIDEALSFLDKAKNSPFPDVQEQASLALQTIESSFDASEDKAPHRQKYQTIKDLCQQMTATKDKGAKRRTKEQKEAYDKALARYQKSKAQKPTTAEGKIELESMGSEPDIRRHTSTKKSVRNLGGIIRSGTKKENFNGLTATQIELCRKYHLSRREFDVLQLYGKANEKSIQEWQKEFEGLDNGREVYARFLDIGGHKTSLHSGSEVERIKRDVMAQMIMDKFPGAYTEGEMPSVQAGLIESFLRSPNYTAFGDRLYQTHKKDREIENRYNDYRKLMLKLTGKEKLLSQRQLNAARVSSETPNPLLPREEVILKKVKDWFEGNSYIKGDLLKASRYLQICDDLMQKEEQGIYTADGTKIKIYDEKGSITDEAADFIKSNYPDAPHLLNDMDSLFLKAILKRVSDNPEERRKRMEQRAAQAAKSTASASTPGKGGQSADEFETLFVVGSDDLKPADTASANASGTEIQGGELSPDEIGLPPPPASMGAPPSPPTVDAETRLGRKRSGAVGSREDAKATEFKESDVPPPPPASMGAPPSPPTVDEETRLGRKRSGAVGSREDAKATGLEESSSVSSSDKSTTTTVVDDATEPPAVDNSPEAKRRRQRDAGLHEIIETESTYINGISRIADGAFMPIQADGTLRRNALREKEGPMMQAVKASSQLNGDQKSVLQECFRTIAIIGEFNKELHKQFTTLQQCYDSTDPADVAVREDCIKEIMKLLEQSRAFYASYLKVFTKIKDPAILEALQKSDPALLAALKEKNPALVAKLEEKGTSSLSSIFNEQVNGIGFDGYAIMPVQRLPKYPLFFRELIKNTEEKHPMHGLMVQLQNKVEEVLGKINTSKKEDDEVMAQLSHSVATQAFQEIKPKWSTGKALNVTIEREGLQLKDIYGELLSIDSIADRQITIDWKGAGFPIIIKADGNTVARMQMKDGILHLKSAGKRRTNLKDLETIQGIVQAIVHSKTLHVDKAQVKHDSKNKNAREQFEHLLLGPKVDVKKKVAAAVVDLDTARARATTTPMPTIRTSSMTPADDDIRKRSATTAAPGGLEGATQATKESKRDKRSRSMSISEAKRKASETRQRRASLPPQFDADDPEQIRRAAEIIAQAKAAQAKQKAGADASSGATETGPKETRDIIAGGDVSEMEQRIQEIRDKKAPFVIDEYRDLIQAAAAKGSELAQQEADVPDLSTSDAKAKQKAASPVSTVTHETEVEALNTREIIARGDISEMEKRIQEIRTSQAPLVIDEYRALITTAAENGSELAQTLQARYQLGMGTLGQQLDHGFDQSEATRERALETLARIASSGQSENIKEIASETLEAHEQARAEAATEQKSGAPAQSDTATSERSEHELGVNDPKIAVQTRLAEAAKAKAHKEHEEEDDHRITDDDTPVPPASSHVESPQTTPERSPADAYLLDVMVESYAIATPEDRERIKQDYLERFKDKGEATQAIYAEKYGQCVRLDALARLQQQLQEYNETFDFESASPEDRREAIAFVASVRDQIKEIKEGADPIVRAEADTVQAQFQALKDAKKIRSQELSDTTRPSATKEKGKVRRRSLDALDLPELKLDVPRPSTTGNSSTGATIRVKSASKPDARDPGVSTRADETPPKVGRHRSTADTSRPPPVAFNVPATPPAHPAVFGGTDNLTIKQLHDYAQGNKEKHNIAKINTFNNDESDRARMTGLEIKFNRDDASKPPVSAYAHEAENNNVKFSISKNLSDNDKDAAKEAVLKMCRVAVNAAGPNAKFYIPEKLEPAEKRAMVKDCFEQAIREALTMEGTKFKEDTKPTVTDLAETAAARARPGGPH